MKVTTDVGEDKCTSDHGGTSAAAPNAAGVFALALQVRWGLSCLQKTNINDFLATVLT